MRLCMAEDNTLGVTIGIPTYNRADSFLKNALESALAQQYENLEIVVSDNCSTDHTQELIRDMDDGRIRYFRQKENIPANDNFNFCLQQATKDYFLLLHDDDLIDADFVETCIAAANGNPDIGVILTGTRMIDGRGHTVIENRNKVAGLSLDDFLLGWFNSRIALYLCSTLYNTKVLKAIGGFNSPTDLFQDVVATVRLAASHGRVDVAEIKASFRAHGDNRGGVARVVDWSIDSRFLLDVISESVTEKRSLVRQEGLRYFCLKNYQKAATIPDLPGRWKVYYHIYKEFERCCPLSYVIRKYELRKLKSWLKPKNE